MSFLINLDAVTPVISQLTSLGSALDAAAVSVVLPTTTIPPPGADEVSSLITGLLNGQGNGFQDVVSAFLALLVAFIKLLLAAVGLYADTESTNSTGLLGGLVGGLL